jgi:hypothetical protein
MEFFQIIQNIDVEDDELKKLLTLNSLPDLCASIDTVRCLKNNEGEIYCLWGSFDIRREEIRHGVRFSLVNCPHALVWTVTVDKNKRTIVVHCTIDKREQDEDFVESIELFVMDWAKGISLLLQAA